MSIHMTEWQCHPKAEALVLKLLENSSQANPLITQLQKELQELTSTRLFDWLDHLIAENKPAFEKEVLNVGYSLESETASYKVFRHLGAQLPRLVLSSKKQEEGIAVTVDDIADFLMVRGWSFDIEGTPFASYRRCLIETESRSKLWVVERRCSGIMEPVYQDTHYLNSFYSAKEAWKTRPRSLENQDEAMQETLILAKKMIALVGQDLAAWIVLECEREYWQSRNSAAQIQKNRQDRLGMGWANHDHHTFRSSRRQFANMIKFFELLGFYCRERFYAGKEAGWGAQVMEHPNTRLVLFLDVDLEPNEIEVDFRSKPLGELKKMSTVGLWCALHGDSILKAGMHHLEAQFLFEDLTQDLATLGVGMMNPFSNFPYLRQAFTKGETWKVKEKTVQKLLSDGLITKEQADKFITQGAIGSHLENLQRREGYKGFNQNNVSYIIQKTDPRNG